MARRQVVISDLRRSRSGFVIAWIGTRLLSRSPVVHYDGPVSVRAAWTIRELAGFAARGSDEWSARSSLLALCECCWCGRGWEQTPREHFRHILGCGDRGRRRGVGRGGGDACRAGVARSAHRKVRVAAQKSLRRMPHRRGGRCVSRNWNRRGDSGSPADRFGFLARGRRGTGAFHSRRNGAFASGPGRGRRFGGGPPWMRVSARCFRIAVAGLCGRFVPQPEIAILRSHGDHSRRRRARLRWH